MAQQLIISIGREFGSGGHEIAKMIAKHYGLELYDRNLLDEIAMERDLDGELLKSFDEKRKNIFLSRTVGNFSSSPEENIAHLQFKYLRSKAEEGKSFVVVGRCSDYILKEYSGMVSLFVLADMESKVERIKELYHLSERAAKDKIKRHDRYRKEYHNSYCKLKWGDTRSYDLSVNSSRLGVEKTFQALVQYIDLRREILKEE